MPAAPRVAPRCNDRPAIEKFRWCLRRVETSVRGFGRSLSVLKEPRDLCDSLELSTVRIAPETTEFSELSNETQIAACRWTLA